MNITIKKYFPAITVGLYEKEAVVNFLFENLEQYGDRKEDIRKAVEYALNAGNHPGGMVLVMFDNDRIVGAVVINKTGMEGYIPENVLVYIATHKEYRGKGLGKKLMQRALDETMGDVALHVEPDNPARHLYEKMGFTSKYMEMRWKKK